MKKSSECQKISVFGLFSVRRSHELRGLHKLVKTCWLMLSSRSDGVELVRFLTRIDLIGRINIIIWICFFFQQCLFADMMNHCLRSLNIHDWPFPSHRYHFINSVRDPAGGALLCLNSTFKRVYCHSSHIHSTQCSHVSQEASVQTNNNNTKCYM